MILIKSLPKEFIVEDPHSSNIGEFKRWPIRCASTSNSQVAFIVTNFKSQWAAIQSHINDFDHCLTTQLGSFVAPPFVFDQGFTVNITALAQHSHKVHQQVLDTAKSDARKEWKDKMQASPFGAQAFRH